MPSLISVPVNIDNPLTILAFSPILSPTLPYFPVRLLRLHSSHALCQRLPYAYSSRPTTRPQAAEEARQFREHCHSIFHPIYTITSPRFGPVILSLQSLIITFSLSLSLSVFPSRFLFHLSLLYLTGLAIVLLDRNIKERCDVLLTPCPLSSMVYLKTWPFLMC